MKYNFNLNRNLRHDPIIRVVGGCLALILALCLPSCSGSCSRHGEQQGVAITGEDIANVDSILSQQVEFDAGMIAQMNAMLRQNDEPSPADVARAVMVASAASNRLTHILIGLQQNDDIADTWNMLTELAQMGWPKDTQQLLETLRGLPMTENTEARLAATEQDWSQNREIIDRLSTQFKNPPQVLK